MLGHGNEHCCSRISSWYKQIEDFFLMEVIRGSSEASAQLSAEICCISCCDLFLKNMERALCVWLEDKTQTWLLVGVL